MAKLSRALALLISSDLTDRRFRALALDTSLKSFRKKFTLKDEALHAKEFCVEIGGSDRWCILYYSAEKAERDRKSREICLKARQRSHPIRSGLWTREGVAGGRRRTASRAGLRSCLKGPERGITLVAEG
jgi:hypothetical protein